MKILRQTSHSVMLLMCLAEHMKVVSLRHLRFELLFRKSPTINLGLYHTVLYAINVPKVELLAQTQKVCFFCINSLLMQRPVP